ncbi:hypothetical protein N0V82_006167 [Gnomoniopsis sp. IMI 355080]|nr:hypothetical protein N0V82_006167 [Gnomoniopsis sp. IMI 355080]
MSAIARAFLAIIPLVQAASIRQVSSTCKAIPGDSAWPSQDTWDSLNQTVEGRLIATIPQAAVCHPQGFGTLSYNETTCNSLKAAYNMPATLSVLSKPWKTTTQLTDTSPMYNGTCELGNLVSYSISVSGAEDVVAGINFARDNNVRLVVKNTGHDFLGKSSGKGGLSLWTHNLQGWEIIESYNSTMYTGPAAKIGAGVTGGEALILANKNGYTLVTGDCPTVGVAGGYASGGGHGYLNSAYGMGADQILEVEVVTADGQYLTASPTNNEDLYWAIAGGGAGTYAVVLSMTYKIYPDIVVGAATLAFNRTAASSDEAYLAAMAAWWQFLPTLVDSGATAAFNVIPDQFLVYNTTAPGQTAADMDALYEPYLAQLRNLSVPYTYNSYTAPSYFAHYNVTNGPLPDGPYTASPLFNSRIIPRAVSLSAERARNVSETMIAVTEIDISANYQYGCMGLNVSSNSARFNHADNALAPYWRDAIAICLHYSVYDWEVPQEVMLQRKKTIAEVIYPAIEAATPDSGSYLNEGDPLVYPMDDDAKWQTAFYGSNYAALRQVKDKWDSESIFYSYTAVGSEDWSVDANGRLCKI